jgi:hypothetical protein
MIKRLARWILRNEPDDDPYLETRLIYSEQTIDTLRFILQVREGENLRVVAERRMKMLMDGPETVKIQ